MHHHLLRHHHNRAITISYPRRWRGVVREDIELAEQDRLQTELQSLDGWMAGWSDDGQRGCLNSRGINNYEEIMQRRFLRRRLLQIEYRARGFSG